MLHCYRLALMPEDSIDMTSSLFGSAVDAARDGARRVIALLGGDPLPDQEVLLRIDVDRRTVTLIWRSHLVPPDADPLIEKMREIANDLDDWIKAWHLDHHICGHGKRRPCEPWRSLAEG